MKYDVKKNKKNNTLTNKEGEIWDEFKQSWKEAMMLSKLDSASAIHRESWNIVG